MSTNGEKHRVPRVSFYQIQQESFEISCSNDKAHSLIASDNEGKTGRENR